MTQILTDSRGFFKKFVKFRWIRVIRVPIMVLSAKARRDWNFYPNFAPCAP